VKSAAACAAGPATGAVRPAAGNVTHPIGPRAELMRYYTERWSHHGHDPAMAAVGAGTARYCALADPAPAAR
jgi:hypothetical protein